MNIFLDKTKEQIFIQLCCFRSLIVGTSPALELAVYTACVLARAEDAECVVSLGGRTATVTTHTFSRPGGVRYIASAFFDWK